MRGHRLLMLGRRHRLLLIFEILCDEWLERHVERQICELLRESRGRPRHRKYAAAQFLDLGLERVVLDHPVNQAPVERRWGVHDISSEGEPLGAPEADMTRDAPHANSGNDALFDCGHAEPRVGSGDTKITRQRELQPTTDAM